MSVGASATLRLFGAFFHFIGDLFYWVAELAFTLGDPELNTPVAFVAVYLLASGRYAKGLFCLLAGTFADLFAKNVLGVEYGSGLGEAL